MSNTLNIGSFNANSITVRLEQVLQIIEQFNIDVLAIQETKTPDKQFPLDAIIDAGYHVLFNGQKSYNGTCFISKYPLEYQTHRLSITALDPQQRFLVAKVGDITLINCYIPNGGEVNSDKYVYKLEWLARLKDYLARTYNFQKDKVIVLGDFNIAPEDIDVYDIEAFAGQTLCTTKERDALKSIQALGLVDAFRLHNTSVAYSWWDYRNRGFQNNEGLRIDLILLSEALQNQCSACTIETTPRTWDRPSDHTPVIASILN